MAAHPNEYDELLARHGRRFDAGTILFREGERAEEAFLLTAGRVRLFKQVGAMERSLRVVRPGELFGESALLEGSLRAATAIPLDDIEVLPLAPDTLGRVLGSSPDLGAQVLGQLVRRLRDAEDQVEILMLGDAQAKIVVALIKLAQHSQQGDTRPDDAVPRAGGRAGAQLALAVSPLELSTHVGLDVDSVKRIVLGLRESGYLQIRDERVEIHDLAALRELYSLLSVRDRLRGSTRHDARSGGR